MSSKVEIKKTTRYVPVQITADVFDVQEGPEFIHISLDPYAPGGCAWVTCRGPNGVKLGRHVSLTELREALATLCQQLPANTAGACA